MSALHSTFTLLFITALLVTSFTAFNIDVKAAGSIANPFTTLSQAGEVKLPGKYYFNINGKTFISYVNTQRGGGWVLVAGGNYATTETAYTKSTDLDQRSDKILPPDVVAALTDTYEVRINATNRPHQLDIVSRDATVKSRLLSYTTLGYDTLADELKTKWSGFDTLGKINRVSSSACVGYNNSLDKGIIDNCGNASGLRWVVANNAESVSGVNRQDNLHLWVRGRPKRLITKVKMEYQGVMTSYTIFNTVRILDQTGAQYPAGAWKIIEQFNLGYGSALIGQNVEAAAIQPIGNQRGYLVIEHTGIGAQSGFRGWTANYRIDANSTQLLSATATFEDNTTVVNSIGGTRPAANNHTTWCPIAARVN
jgi:hypothetical protein